MRAAGNWHKAQLVKTKANGRHKVAWQDGTTTTLNADCVLARNKAAHKSSG